MVLVLVVFLAVKVLPAGHGRRFWGGCYDNLDRGSQAAWIHNSRGKVNIPVNV